MKALKSLIENNSDVWFYCSTKELQLRFLKQCEVEGFLALNGQKPTDLNPYKYYGISSNMTVGYLSAMCWFLSAKYPGGALSVASGKNITSPVRIDYEKYIR